MSFITSFEQLARDADEWARTTRAGGDYLFEWQYAYGECPYDTKRVNRVLRKRGLMLKDDGRGMRAVKVSG